MGEEEGRERSSTLSLVLATTVSFRLSERQSSPRRRGLRIETKIQEFCLPPRSRGFSPTWFNSCLRVIQMVEVFGVGTALHFSPKILGLNVGFLGLFSDSPGLDFRGCFYSFMETLRSKPS